jgi:predicted TIM-barrel fold metal-dependent hydrolase
VTHARTGAAEIREGLDHPIIDVDGHFVENIPMLSEQLASVLGREAMTRLERDPFWAAMIGTERWTSTSEAERLHHWMVAAPWWGMPGRTEDRATAFSPSVLASRLDELGVDFTVVYPTLGNVMMSLADDELRQAACRALNEYGAALVAPHSDRMTTPALIPMYTPEEALAELDHAVETLGLRCIVIDDFVRRPIAALQDGPKELGPGRTRIDAYGIDSPHDYDPFWARCQALGVPVTTHGGSQGIGFRQSPSLFNYNHIGHFAAAHEALAKSLFFGGVTKRFPELHFAFLEGGVGWAISLYADLFEHWEKRGGSNIQHLDPAGTDWQQLQRLLETRDGAHWSDPDLQNALRRHQTSHPEQLDDFAGAGIEKLEDIHDRFVPNFFFGCESDDRTAAWAFARRYHPFQAKLQAMFSSDFGHWDVRDMRDVVPSAYGLVENELIDSAEFRDFACDHAMHLYTGMNSDFFAGTRVEDYAASHLSSRAC